MSLQDLINSALSPNGPMGASVDTVEAAQIIQAALAAGMGAEQISQMSGVPVSEIQQYVNQYSQNLNTLGVNQNQQQSLFNMPPPVVDTGAAVVDAGQTGGQTSGQGGAGASANGGQVYQAVVDAQNNAGAGGQPSGQSGPGFIQGQGGGGGAAPTASPADWAQIAQGNTDYITALQNSIFQNPNIRLPDGSTQTTSFGNMPDYAGYVRNNPDLLADFQSPNNPIKDLAAYGRYHWETLGKGDGRQMPTGNPSDLGFLQPEVNVQLSPAEQAIYNSDQRGRAYRSGLAESLLGRVNERFATDVDPSGLWDPSTELTREGLPEITTDPSVGGYESIKNALYEREQPFMERRRGSLENDLLVRGLNPGTEAWNARFDDLNRAENDFRLGLNTIAGEEQSRMFNLEGQRRQQEIGERELAYGLGRDWRQNQVNETLANRMLPLNEYNALMSGTQMGLPNMTPYQSTGWQGPNFAASEQETYNRQFTEDQQRRQNRNQLFTGVAQLGGSLFGAFGS